MEPIVKHLAGSLAYGTNLPTSDVDYRGIYCDPPRGIVTPWSPARSKEWEDPTEEDTKLFELHNFMELYVDGSPNIIESLWVEPEHITESTEVYDYLRANAPNLLSKKLRYTFGGYAMGQLKRIKGHNKWLNKPQPEAAPVRADYFKMIQNFTERQIFSKDFNIRHCNGHHILVPYGNDIYGVVYCRGGMILNHDGSIRKEKYEGLSDEIKKKCPNFIVKLNEDVFKQDLDTHKNYWRWKRERNESRSELEELHGYDTKHAMHLVRLLRMGEEVLRDGVVNVKRDDAKELLAIRGGEWGYDFLLEWAEHQDNELSKLFKTSDLPLRPDYRLAGEVLLTAEGMWHDSHK